MFFFTINVYFFGISVTIGFVFVSLVDGLFLNGRSDFARIDFVNWFAFPKIDYFYEPFLFNYNDFFYIFDETYQISLFRKFAYFVSTFLTKFFVFGTLDFVLLLNVFVAFFEIDFVNLFVFVNNSWVYAAFFDTCLQIHKIVFGNFVTVFSVSHR